jgi:hypothetical protein
MIGREQGIGTKVLPVRMLGVERHERHHQCCRGIAAQKAIAFGEDHFGAGFRSAKRGAQSCRATAYDENVGLCGKEGRSWRQPYGFSMSWPRGHGHEISSWARDVPSCR